MFNLLYKEFRLAAHPTLYIFMLLGFLVIVPSYPYGAVFLFGCLASFITFNNGRENHDAFYTALLPVRKKDIVRAKCMLIIIVELGQIIISLPFAYLRTIIIKGGNPVGIEANVAYYGFGLIIFALFNLIFFTEFYKTAYKVGRAFLLAIIPVIFCIIAMEALAHIPNMKWIDSIESNMMMKQLPILLAGIIIYSVFTILAYHIATKRFNDVDL